MIDFFMDNNKEKVFKIIEWISFIILCGISAYFVRDNLDKYFSKKKSVTISEGPITTLPTITLCFSSNEPNNLTYDFGIDFNIDYCVESECEILNEGENKVQEENVNLNEIATTDLKICHMITSKSDSIGIGKVRSLSLYFNESISPNDTIILKMYISSAKNAYGIVTNRWKDGKVLQFDVEKDTSKVISLKPVQREYIKTDEQCNIQSFFECYEKVLDTALNVCPNKCVYYSLPTLPLCKNEDESKCSMDIELDVWINVTRTKNKDTARPRPCSTLEYTGEEMSVYSIVSDYNTTAFEIYYRFGSPELVTMYNEYVVYDGIAIVGSVGGTLGMCIGFSFTNIVSILIKTFQSTIGIFQRKISIKVLAKDVIVVEPIKEEKQLNQFQNKTRKSLINERKQQGEKMIDERLDQIELKLDHIYKKLHEFEIKQ